MSTKLYSELAPWWPLMSSPSEYAEEAAIYSGILRSRGDAPCETLLELGSGGGNNASHIKSHFRMTLTDLSPGMLEVSRALNPDCEHHQGDMRSLRLARQFDRVLIHDAICYMLTEADLRAAVETAYLHTRPGGAALFCPDHVTDTFTPATDHGGNDDGPRGLRYLEWAYDPDPTDTTVAVDYAYLLRDPDGTTRAVHDRHIEGLFPRATWLRVLTDVGFQAEMIPLAHSDVEPGTVEMFAGIKPR
ncbi:MAG: class I SAM-dependent methyltransferase [Polyangiaceae bacterium]